MYALIYIFLYQVRREISDLSMVHWFFQISRSPMVKSQTRLSKTILSIALMPLMLHLHDGVIIMLFPGEIQIRRWSQQ